MDHLNGDIPCIIQHDPTHWVATVLVGFDEKEKKLILEFDPPCNQRVG